jgi:hypothetical protein
MIDGVILYMLILAGIFVPLSAFIWYMAHRQRLEEEAEEDQRGPHGTPAE